MTNAVRTAADFLARLPRDCLSPETTEGREGFLHPYDIQGGVAEVKSVCVFTGVVTAGDADTGTTHSAAIKATATRIPNHLKPFIFYSSVSLISFTLLKSGMVDSR